MRSPDSGPQKCEDAVRTRRAEGASRSLTMEPHLKPEVLNVAEPSEEPNKPPDILRCVESSRLYSETAWIAVRDFKVEYNDTEERNRGARRLPQGELPAPADARPS